jgi:hypothetical protein
MLFDMESIAPVSVSVDAYNHFSGSGTKMVIGSSRKIQSERDVVNRELALAVAHRAALISTRGHNVNMLYFFRSNLITAIIHYVSTSVFLICAK